MALSINNLSKPSNKKWKRIADILLFTLPLYLAVVMIAPVPDDAKGWINVVITIIIITIKAVTKFTADENAGQV